MHVSKIKTILFVLGNIHENIRLINGMHNKIKCVFEKATKHIFAALVLACCQSLIPDQNDLHSFPVRYILLSRLDSEICSRPTLLKKIHFSTG